MESTLLITMQLLVMNLTDCSQTRSKRKSLKQPIGTSACMTSPLKHSSSSISHNKQEPASVIRPRILADSNTIYIFFSKCVSFLFKRYKPKSSRKCHFMYALLINWFLLKSSMSWKLYLEITKQWHTFQKKKLIKKL